MSLPISWNDPEFIDATERVPFQPDFDQSAEPLPPMPDGSDAKIDLAATDAPRRTLPPPIPMRALKSAAFPIVQAARGTRPPPIPARARTQSSPPPIPARAIKPTASAQDGDDSIEVDLTDAPLPRDPRRGTAPPPFRAQTEHPFVVYPAPVQGAPTPTTMILEAAVAPPQITVRAISETAHLDPTPLPRPYVDLTGDTWFDAGPVVETTDGLDAELASMSLSKRRWPIALALFVSVIAVVALGTRAFLGSGTDAAPHRSHAVAKDLPVEQPAVAAAAAIAPRAAEPVAPPVAEPVAAAAAEPVAEEKAEPAAAPEVAAEPAPSEPVAVATSKPAATKTSKRVAASHSSSRGQASTHRAVAAAMPRSTPTRTGGRGTLMLSSKPPCEIVIDGVPTARTTPQRSLQLSAGNHKVKLLNAENRINATFEIVIEGRKTTKLIRDFTKK